MKREEFERNRGAVVVNFGGGLVGMQVSPDVLDLIKGQEVSKIEIYRKPRAKAAVANKPTRRKKKGKQ